MKQAPSLKKTHGPVLGVLFSLKYVEMGIHPWEWTGQTWALERGSTYLSPPHWLCWQVALPELGKNFRHEWMNGWGRSRENKGLLCPHTQMQGLHRGLVSRRGERQRRALTVGQGLAPCSDLWPLVDVEVTSIGYFSETDAENLAENVVSDRWYSNCCSINWPEKENLKED